MPPKHSRHSSSSSQLSSSSFSDYSFARSSKRQRTSSLTSEDEDSHKPLKLYILQAKLEPQTIAELYTILENPQSQTSGNSKHLNAELCNEVDEADVIITGIRMRKRLERHIDWKIAHQKALVTPEWLIKSAEQASPVPCGEYAALSELHDETVEHCPDHDCGECTGKQSPRKATDTHTHPNHPPSTFGISPRSMSTLGYQDTTSPKVKENWKGDYACTRASPLVCPNQTLAAELGILSRSRELEGKQVNALSYDRAIAMIKSYPKVIDAKNFKSDISKMPHFGSKILSKVKEFLEKGFIEESREIRESKRYQALTQFTTVYGVGPSTARKLYDIGLRTIEDMERYYDVPVGLDNTYLETIEAGLVTPNGKKITTKSNLPNMSIKVALAVRKDIDILISREEVEEIHSAVMNELEKLQPGCLSTVVGGVRRGKLRSNDVDIVISHPDLQSGKEQVKGLCTRLTKHLHKEGMVTHVMHLSGFHEHNPLRTEHWDSLEKALTIFVLPPKQGQKKLHRRVDLIFASPEAYWTAVVGWSGSKMFERDLRLWAKKEKGMKFDSSGLTRRHDSKLYIPRSEKEVFDILGLEWIDPIMRNADV